LSTLFVLHRSPDAQTLLIYGVFQCSTRIVSDTYTCNYIELYYFFKILSVFSSLCQCHVRCSCPRPCFI